MYYREHLGSASNEQFITRSWSCWDFWVSDPACRLVVRTIRSINNFLVNESQFSHQPWLPTITFCLERLDINIVERPKSFSDLDKQPTCTLGTKCLVLVYQYRTLKFCTPYLCIVAKFIDAIRPHVTYYFASLVVKIENWFRPSSLISLHGNPKILSIWSWEFLPGNTAKSST